MSGGGGVWFTGGMDPWVGFGWGGYGWVGHWRVFGACHLRL